jgi:predicted nucleic acid-binding protein
MVIDAISQPDFPLPQQMLIDTSFLPALRLINETLHAVITQILCTVGQPVDTDVTTGSANQPK